MTGAGPREDKEEECCDSTSVVLFERWNHRPGLATRLCKSLPVIVMIECLDECYSSVETQ